MHCCVCNFVPWVFLLHIMPRDLHFACVHAVYRVRKRILTAYHIVFATWRKRKSTVPSMKKTEVF